MDKRAWLAAQTDFDTKRAMPIISFPCVKKLGISVRELVTDSENQAEGMAAIAAEYPSAAAVSMMDLSVEAEMFGSKVIFEENEIPTIREAIIFDEDDAAALEVPYLPETLDGITPELTGRCGTYARAIALAKKKITDRPVFAGVIGPFSLAGRLMDMTEIMVNCYADPDSVETVLDKCAQFIVKYIKLLKSAGADGVVVAEPAAGLLSPDFNRRFSCPYVRRIIGEVISDEFMFIYHNCGKVEKLIGDIIELGADAYHFGNAVDLAELAKSIPEEIVFMGNIDPVGAFCGEPEKAYADTVGLLEKLGRRRGFIPSSGCDVPAKANPASIGEFYRAVGEYYR